MKKERSAVSIILFSIILASLASLAYFSYQKYLVYDDFILYAQVTCDPELESCFIYECDPETEGGCDVAEPYWYYKVIHMYAPDAPSCTPTAEADCPELVCEPGIRCEEIVCDETTVSEYSDAETCA